MSPVMVGVLAIVLWVVLVLLRMPVGMALMAVMVGGYWYLEGSEPTLYTLGTIPYRFATSYIFTVLPPFALMGQLAAYTGFSGEAYDVARAWIGHWRGGLAIATIVGCTMFSAVVGSPIACLVTMVAVSLPEMRRAGYDDKLSTGSLAAGSLLGPMIPPSTVFIMYAFLTEVNLGDLFIAGICPGLIMCVLYCITIAIWAKIDPKIAPSMITPATWRVRLTKAPQVWGIGFVFVACIGGMFVGFFTPTEAGSIGAFVVLALALVRRKLTWSNFNRSLLDTGRLVGMFFILFTGVYLFNNLLAISRIPDMLVDFCLGFPGGYWGVMIAVYLMYLITGLFMDAMAVVFITVPVLYPAVQAMGFDLVWFGVIILFLADIGAITPPYGISVFALRGMVKDIPMWTIFRGCFPFLISLTVGLVLLSVFPQIATWLVYLFKPAGL